MQHDLVTTLERIADHLGAMQMTAFAFQAMTGAFAMVLELRGKGSKYIAAFHGADGEHLDGGRKNGERTYAVQPE